MCPRSNILFRVACCYTRVHVQCLRGLGYTHVCSECHEEIDVTYIRKYKNVNYRSFPFRNNVLPQDFFLYTHPHNIFVFDVVDNDQFDNSFIAKLLKTPH